MIFTNSSTRFYKSPFKNEEEVEKVVLDNAKLLFGDYSVVLAKFQIVTKTGKGTIPDGIIIDFGNRRWYVMEVEYHKHDLYDHIGKQIQKQQIAAENIENRPKIAERCVELIKKLSGKVGDENIMNLLEQDLGINPIDIRKVIDQILLTDPVFYLPIDGVNEDMLSWASKHNVEIQLIERYADHNGNFLYDFPGLEAKLDEVKTTTSEKVDRLPLLIDAGLLKVNEKVHFDYGPKGQPKKHFTGTIKRDGVEVGGVTYAPSIASLLCVQTLSPKRTTSNGWDSWKTADGKSIIAKWNRFLKKSDKKTKTILENKKAEPEGVTINNDLMHVIKSGSISIGDKIWFKYGPKGMPKTLFEGTICKDGIKTNGKTFKSVSVAAISCIQTVRPETASCNGWTTWKTVDGKYLDELRKKAK